MLNAKLIVVGGDAKAGEVRLRLPCIIGRGNEATLTLPHPLVSRTHCEISERNGSLVVRDLGSMNGTYVDNKKIDSEETLAPGKLLTLGNVTFRAAYEPGHELIEEAPVGDSPNRLSTKPPSNRTEASANKSVESSSEGEPDPSLDVMADTVEEDNCTNDTDKSLPQIDISFEEVTDDEKMPSQIEIDAEDRAPVSVVGNSDLDGLDLPNTPQVSFKGGIDLGADAVSAVDASRLELEVDDKQGVDAGEELDSFLKKLPR